MIRFEELREVYDWDAKTFVGRRGKESFYEATRRTRLRGQPTEEKVTIKVVEGVVLHGTDAKTLINDIHQVISPLVASVKGQGDLIAAVEAWAFKESDLLVANGVLVDVVIVQEKFGEDLEIFLQGSKKDSYDERSVDGLACFLIRLLRLVEQRGLRVPNLTPKTILYDGGCGFKLRGLADAALHHSCDAASDIFVDDAFASPAILMAMNEQDAARTTKEWKENELYSAGLTLLQFATGLKRSQLKALREAQLKGQAWLIDREIDSLQGCYPQLGKRLRAAIKLLLDGVPIEDVARAYEADGNQTLGLSTEDHKVLNDLLM